MTFKEPMSTRSLCRSMTTPAADFFDTRAINPRIMATVAIGDHPEADAFIEHTDCRVRRMYAIDAKWRRKLERESNADRDFILMFIRHWAEAFRNNPARYLKDENQKSS